MDGEFKREESIFPRATGDSYGERPSPGNAFGINLWTSAGRLSYTPKHIHLKCSVVRQMSAIEDRAENAFDRFRLEKSAPIPA
jgi:hypothetical protein